MSDLSILFISVFTALLSFACNPTSIDTTPIASSFNEGHQEEFNTTVIVGADRIALYYPMLEGKRVALVVNQTSRVGHMHLVDTLVQMGVDIVKIFAPEHGFRGEADAGAKVSDAKDSKTGLPILSLYGSNRKPSKEQLEGVDIVLFDIQDVGVRFYTYISTMTLVMEACAEMALPIIVLDRPNPNGHYIDGPVLEEGWESFVGMHQVPVVYGMTIGEYAKMVNGEGWLNDGLYCSLTVIPCKNYDHNTYYNLPIPPSPNLPNIQSILLYPSLCFFEGTTVSVGRGTSKQFQIIGHPQFQDEGFSFTPVSSPGAKYPKHENQICYGKDLSSLTKGSLFDSKRLDLSYLLEAYESFDGDEFFNDNNFFDKLAGTDQLKDQVIRGNTEDEIRSTGKNDIDRFKLIRSKYLIYPE